MPEFSRAEVEVALQEVGLLLVRAKKVAEIVVFGGVAMMLQFDVSFKTGDVDAVVRSGDHGTLLRAVHTVAKKHGWPTSWLNESVQMYTSQVGESDFYKSYPSEGNVGLRVYTAKPDYLLAMKLLALRIGSRDETDALLLARHTGIITVDGMLDLLHKYYPKGPVNDRLRVMIWQLAEKLHAPAPEQPE